MGYSAGFIISKLASLERTTKDETDQPENGSNRKDRPQKLRKSIRRTVYRTLENKTQQRK